VSTLNKNIESLLSAGIRDIVSQGLHVKDGVIALQEVLDNAGVSFSNPFVYETMFRTEVNIAYAAGRQIQNSDPAIREILFGYSYAAIDDERITDICSQLNGTIAAVDDPIWDTCTPPNHYNCRSTLIEVFKDDDNASSTEVPNVKPDEGFDRTPEQMISYG
jgi:SPP1 gp7 family putative phage head morphogenesis protein